jgi:hypothetical protein
MESAMKIKNLLMVSIVLFSLSACKKLSQKGEGNENSLQGIDTITGQEIGLTTVGCGVELTDVQQAVYETWLRSRLAFEEQSAKIPSEEKDAIRTAIYQTLGVIPPKFMAYLKTIGMSIEIKQRGLTASDCGIETSAEESFLKSYGQSEILSCYRHGAENKDAITLVLGKETDEKKIADYQRNLSGDELINGQLMVIRQHLVRTVGLVYSRFSRILLNTAIKNNESPELGLTEIVTDMDKAVDVNKQRREDLQEAFFADLKSQDDKTNESKSLKQAQNKLDNINAVDSGMFADMLVAEVFDSYYCNASSRDFMNENYSQTNGVFVNNFVEADF